MIPVDKWHDCTGKKDLGARVYYNGNPHLISNVLYVCQECGKVSVGSERKVNEIKVPFEKALKNLLKRLERTGTKAKEIILRSWATRFLSKKFLRKLQATGIFIII
ncbi:hypothetical protein COS59_01985 [Candidatus Wolfebacteria bacterium CG03_land_8_20_14_0_80_36_15]|uniref:Uncharacterized protein n=1 Tax=Candidatus Wolfebacteria bacterium CG03_land_8_20_14_0_80_36_15 TaxID=1975067 RepID=A0A2M7B7G1_9BACT|nr:MAG: hypothetical protein COS59_01985 [Candidatus Wolfebacteria bacterium CG03_land_8_20_14_0_80_36_15]